MKTGTEAVNKIIMLGWKLENNGKVLEKLKMLCSEDQVISKKFNNICLQMKSYCTGTYFEQIENIKISNGC